MFMDLLPERFTPGRTAVMQDNEWWYVDIQFIF